MELDEGEEHIISIWDRKLGRTVPNGVGMVLATMNSYLFNNANGLSMV